MARLLSQTLIRSSSSSSPATSPSLSLSSRIFSLRNRSSKSGKAQLIEVDLESSDNEVEVLGIKKLEDVIHSIIVRRSAPDWLPFIPGSSYWVPPKPRRPYNVVELVGKLANPLNEDETMSLSTVRGWPSSTYFIEGSASMQPVPMEIKVEVESNSENASRSEDEG